MKCDISLINKLFDDIVPPSLRNRNQDGFIELHKLKDPSYYVIKKNKKDD